MMKTLYLGYYDFPFGCSAYILENNEFVKYEMENEELYDFEDLICLEVACERYKEIEEKLNKYFKEFDRIIACEDGAFYLLK